MDPLILILILLVPFGIALGWYLGSRQTAALRKERDERLDDFRRAIADLAVAVADERAKQVPTLQTQLEEVRQACGEARTECARLSSSQQERERAFEARLTELREAREALSAQFGEIGTKLLGDAQKHFLERADARFNQAGEKHEEKLKSLLQPVEATLKRYEEGLTRVEKEREGSYRELNKAVELLHAGHSQVRDETARLVNALRHSPKSAAAGASNRCATCWSRRGSRLMRTSAPKYR